LPNLNVAYRKQGDAYQQGVENDQEEEKPSPVIKEGLVKGKATLPYSSKDPFLDHFPHKPLVDLPPRSQLSIATPVSRSRPVIC
jgi:hypothetical protein